jgi:ubiquitin-small subunit ribosomal protein S27Ae
MARKQVKNKKPSERWKKYKLEGNKVIRDKTCPKCGPAYFLAKHSNRVYCGNCHYVEMLKKEESK